MSRQDVTSERRLTSGRDRVVQRTRKRTADRDLIENVGSIDIQPNAARLALHDKTATAAINDPGVETTNRIMIGRILAARGVLKSVELGMEGAGGRAFYCATGLERLFRDAQASRNHPRREGAQQKFSGRFALGMEVDE